MKNILAPVDFSKEAAHAALYAGALAQHLNAQLTLLFVFHMPIPISEAPYPIDFDTLEKENRKMLKDLAEEIESKYQVKAKQMIIAGFADDEILDATAGNEYDLIVMGSRGSGNRLSEWMGSTTTAVLTKSVVPVLVIPEHVTFSIPRVIALACDFQKTTKARVFAPLSSLSRQFESTVKILNVSEEKEQEALQDKNSELEKQLNGIPHTYCFESAIDVEKGINKFLNAHPADWMAIVVHKHSFINRLFFETYAKPLAMHTRIPLLALSEAVSVHAVKA